MKIALYSWYIKLSFRKNIKHSWISSQVLLNNFIPPYNLNVSPSHGAICVNDESIHSRL